MLPDFATLHTGSSTYGTSIRLEKTLVLGSSSDFTFYLPDSLTSSGTIIAIIAEMHGSWAFSDSFFYHKPETHLTQLQGTNIRYKILGFIG